LRAIFLQADRFKERPECEPGRMSQPYEILHFNHGLGEHLAQRRRKMLGEPRTFAHHHMRC
jgi:hypothetical protein